MTIGMILRKARIHEVRRIKQLIEQHMHEGFMLPRPLSELYENLRDFWVVEEDGEVHGCAGLHIVWENLAEIKSLVVDHFGRKKGWGKKLVEACLDEAQEMKIGRVFALTQIADFFGKLGFQVIDKSELPHKVWSECVRCPKFTECDEIAVNITLFEPAELQNANGDLVVPMPREAAHAVKNP